MLILPMRPQPPRLRIQEGNDLAATSTSSTSTDQEAHLVWKPPSQETSTMLSVLPSLKPLTPLTPKRPKLSLQTTAAAPGHEEKGKTSLTLTLSAATEIPIYANTYVNVFVLPSNPSPSIQHRQNSSPSCPDDELSPPSTNSFSASSSSSGLASPFSMLAPYSLPIGTHSILRNSPLPRKHISAASTRLNRHIFTPVKRVTFRETLEDVIPKSVVNYSSDNSDSDCGEKRPRATFEQTEFRGRLTVEEKEDESVPSSPVHRRRRRRREWVWRPLENDIMTVNHVEEGVEFSSESHSIEKSEPIVSNKAEFNSATCMGLRNLKSMYQ